MKTIIILFSFPCLIFGQLFTVDDNYIEFSGLSSDAEFSANTYLNTLADINISYQIITDSLPTGWDFQNCFPTCNPINTYFTDVISFESDTSIYLNGHFYPNNIPGEGLLRMELEANHGTFVDTVSWRGIAMEETSIRDFLNNSKKIKRITNIKGQEIKNLNNENIVIITDQNNVSTIYYILK